MISPKDIKKLSAYTRIDLASEEEKALCGDLETILEYVKKLKSARGEEEYTDDFVNKLREDAEPHEHGAYREVLINAAPETRDGFIKVKEVFENKE